MDNLLVYFCRCNTEGRKDPDPGRETVPSMGRGKIYVADPDHAHKNSDPEGFDYDTRYSKID